MALDPKQLTFTVVDNTDSVPNSILVGIDAFQADGDGKFDILFDFPPPPGTFNEKFTAGEKVIYDITYTAPITVAAFDFYSAPAGGKGPFKSAAHVLGIGNDGNDSGWIGTGVGTTVIPEPGTMLLFGSGLLGLAGLHRRKSKVR